MSIKRKKKKSLDECAIDFVAQYSREGISLRFSLNYIRNCHTSSDCEFATHVSLIVSVSILFHRDQNHFEWAERWIPCRRIDSYYGAIWSWQKYADGYFNRLHVSQRAKHLHAAARDIRVFRLFHTHALTRMPTLSRLHSVLVVCFF